MQRPVKAGFDQSADKGGHVLKPFSKLLGVIALVAAVGLGGHGVASAANPPSDGGDSSCAPDKHNCYLYHFKLNGRSHTMEFVTYGDNCHSGNPRSRFTVKRKDSANIWLDPAVTKSFNIGFDSSDFQNMDGIDVISCPNDKALRTFLNNENKCWELEVLRTRGKACDWT